MRHEAEAHACACPHGPCDLPQQPAGVWTLAAPACCLPHPVVHLHGVAILGRHIALLGLLLQHRQAALRKGKAGEVQGRWHSARRRRRRWQLGAAARPAIARWLLRSGLMVWWRAVCQRPRGLGRGRLHSEQSAQAITCQDRDLQFIRRVCASDGQQQQRQGRTGAPRHHRDENSASLSQLQRADRALWTRRSGVEG